MRFGLSSFYLYLIPGIYWVDTVMTGEGSDQEAAQAAQAAAEQEVQAQQFQAAQQLAQAQALSQQSQQQYTAAMSTAYSAQRVLGQVPPGLLQAQDQAVPQYDFPQEYHDAAIARAAQTLSFKAPRGFTGYDDDWGRFQLRFKAFLMSSHPMRDGLFKMAEAAG